MEKILKLILKLSLSAIVFLLPLFFLPFTQEFFITHKFYLLSFGALLLLLISTLQFLISKKMIWQKQPFDNLIFLFLITIALSIIIFSPNKIQALLNPNFGLVMMASLAILYFYLSRVPLSSTIYHLPSIILSIITIVFFFQPFKNIDLPQNLTFLKNPSFTPIGSQLDLAIFLGFFVVLGFLRFITDSSLLPTNQSAGGGRFRVTLNRIYSGLGLTFNLIALSLTVYSLFKITPASNFQLPTSISLPPFRLSWYAAVEILKSPLTALFGIGVDNFASIFTRVKDLAYNQSPLWQIHSFNLSRSTLLHLFTETGLFGLIAFSLLLFSLIKLTIGQLNNEGKKSLFIILYSLFILLLFPSSLIVWFLFFLVLSQSAINNQQLKNETIKQSFDFSHLTPIYLGTAIVSFILIAVSSYFLGRSYAAEFSFKKSLDGIVKNNIKDLYDNQRQAIILNPYIERFRLNFSQTNLLIANNIINRQTATESAQLTEEDRQTIIQAIQAAINEAKAAVALNPQKAINWENLAVIYRNILNVAQGADVWTISAYQRAIVLDPQNPIYRLNLGGVFYSLNNWDEAINLFNQSVALKPDWANAYYNLAWASHQKGDYQRAVNAMQNVLNFLDVNTNKADYEKAQKELEEFKKKLPQAEEESTPAGQIQESQLTLPTPPVPQISPKIELPREASPEAR